MASTTDSCELANLEKDELIRIVGMFFGHVVTHYGLWFGQAVSRLGVQEALCLEDSVAQRHFQSMMARLAPHFNIDVRDGIPTLLFEKSSEDLLLLIKDIAKTWVTGDGLWFQAVEKPHGMTVAKAVNDSCWSIFERMEAYKIRLLLGTQVQHPLLLLEQALRFRIYSSINSYSAKWEPDGALIFTMTECRVQSARRRKNMDDYPCKSAGMTEHSEFALGIDPDIVTECVYCPPDKVPERAFCSWRFRLRS